MAYLILVRHGLTDWNKIGRWHGRSDISINEEGRLEARAAAVAIENLKIDKVYTSTLTRTKETFQEMNKVLNLVIPVSASPALDERDYGIYTGRIKWDVEKELGKEKFWLIRRGWDFPIPGGESLKQVYERVVPFFENDLLPVLKNGENILIVSSGNTLRALVKFLENIPDDKVASLHLQFGEVYIYTFDLDGKVIKKEVKRHNYKPLAEWFKLGLQ